MSLLPYRTLFAFLIFALLPAVGQAPEETSAARTEAPASNPKLTAEEITMLARTLGAVRSFEKDAKAAKKLEEAQNKFQEALAKVRKAHEGQDILAMVSSWSEVLSQMSIEEKDRAPSGKGISREDKVTFKDVATGKDITFEYSIFLPNGYDRRKSWPLIIAFHDKGSNGREYLRDVWLPKENKELVELRDQFVIIAPTIGEKTVAPDKNDQIRIEWFEKVHLWGIVRPLRKVLDTYNIDTDRMYLDGAGEGGKTALEIAMMLPRVFAAVSSRGGRPNDVRFLPNTKNLAGTLMLTRKDGIFANEAGKLLKEELLQQKSAHGLDLVIEELDPLPDKGRARQSDTIKEASVEVAKFFLERRRNAYPLAFNFATPNSARFNFTAWLQLTLADALPEDKTIATVEGTIDRESNVIDITSTMVEQFKIFLNDELVDLDRAVKVRVNGQDVIDTKIDRSLEYLLRYNQVNRFDTSVVFVGELQINVPPPVEAPANGEVGDEGK